MKKILALLALVLGVVSCQTEPEGLDVNVGGEVETTVCVSLPEATRANSAVGAFKNVDWSQYTVRYILQVYYNNTPSLERLVKYSDEANVNFSVRLVPGRDYNFVVWADLVKEDSYTENEYNNEHGLYYNTTDLHEITIKEDKWEAMDEKRDAFTGYFNTADGDNRYSAGLPINITLTRPFAKLRVVTTDMVELRNLGIVPDNAVVTYTTKFHESFNACNGEYGEETVVKAHSTAFSIKEYADFVETDQEDSHKVLFTDYFFADDSDVVKFVMDVNENGGALIKSNNFSTDIAVKRNHLTTIQGNILTDGNDVTVTVDEAFDNKNTATDAPYYKETISSAAEFLAALNSPGEFIVISDLEIANVGDTVSNGQVSTFATRAGDAETIVDLNGHVITIKNTKANEAIVNLEENHTLTFVGEGALILTDDSNGSFVNNENGTVKVAAVNHPNNANGIPVFSDDVVDYADLLRKAFAEGGEYSLVYNVSVSETLELAAGKTLVLDLNGKTIFGYDKGTASYGLITNKGDLTVKNGTITLEAKENRGWNAYSSVISNSCGNLTIEDGAHIEHLGGTDMAYGIDNLSGSKSVSTTIKGGHIKSTYRAIRQFMNSKDNDNTLIVNGGIIEGANKSIWMQDPNKNANPGTLNVSENAQLIGDVYLFVTAGSTEWPVEVSIADAAFVGESTVVTGNVPAAYNVVEKDGVWTVEKCYEETENGYAINSVAGLIWVSNEVLNGNTFEGKTIELTADIDLTGVTTNGDSFGPIGRYCSGQDVNKPFKGHFDGQNHTIKGIYQSGWDFGYEWGTTGYLGLFGYAIDVTVENLTIEGMESVVEGGTLAAVAGRADGKCVFKNITVKNTKLGTYNNRCGGIVGWTGYYKNEADETVCDFTFENIEICEDVVLGGLWGSFDSSIGGVMGQLNSGATACVLKNVSIACRIDAYNDCTASYDYYLYRMCGMIIGQMSKTTEIDGSTYPDVAAYGIEFDNVTVNYGKWMNYHYCEPTPGLNGGRGMRVEPGFAYDGLPSDFDHTQCVDNHYNCIPFDQLFGGTQTACKGVKAWEGVTVNYPAAYTCELCGETHNE